MRTHFVKARSKLSVGRVAAALGVLAGLATAQKGLPYDHRQIVPPPGAVGLFAQNMLVRDIDHDGFGDVIATAAQAGVGGVGFAGKVIVLYGPTLSDWKAVEAEEPSPGEMAGFSNNSLAMGDANGDGEWDILLGAAFYDGESGTLKDSGRALLFFGPDLETTVVFVDPLPEIDALFGYALELADLDGDGLDDVVVGAFKKTQQTASGPLPLAGQVWAWYAPDWTIPIEVVQEEPKFHGGFGRYVTTVPAPEQSVGLDLLVDGDGYDVQGTFDGLITRFEGSRLAITQLIASPRDWGTTVNYASLGDQADVNGDGALDLLVHRFQAGFQGQLISAAIVAGPDYMTALATFLEPPGFGEGFAEEGSFSDLDRDGFVDLVLSDVDYSALSGAIQIFWGPDFTSSEVIGPEFFGFNFGGLGKGLEVGDVDADGFDELLVESSAAGIGYLNVFHRRTLQADAETLSIGAGGTVTLRIDLPAERAGHSYLGALSLTDPGPGLILAPGSYAPFAPDALTVLGLGLLGSPILRHFTGTLDGEGDATLVLDWPAGAGPSLVGKTLHVVGLTMGPSGRFGPGTTEVTLGLLP